MRSALIRLKPRWNFQCKHDCNAHLSSNLNRIERKSCKVSEVIKRVSKQTQNSAWNFRVLLPTTIHLLEWCGSIVGFLVLHHLLFSGDKTYHRFEVVIKCRHTLTHTVHLLKLT